MGRVAPVTGPNLRLLGAPRASHASAQRLATQAAPTGAFTQSGLGCFNGACLGLGY